MKFAVQALFLVLALAGCRSSIVADRRSGGGGASGPVVENDGQQPAPEPAPAPGPSSPATGGTADKAAPVITLLGSVDPFLRIGDSQTVRFSAADVGSGVAALSWAFAADGATFGAPQPLAKTATKATVTIPANTPSTLNAKIRIAARDAAGNMATKDSAAFQVVREIKDLYSLARLATGLATGTASATRFNSPQGIAVDGDSVYVSDSQTIVKISLSTGATTPIAGFYGQSGGIDDVGRDARFATPLRLALLGGFLYVTDYGGHCVRKVVIDPSAPGFRTVSTLAGECGTSGMVDDTGAAARFNNPVGIATDGTSLFVADYANHAIRKIDPLNGVVTTFAGVMGSSGAVDLADTSARFNQPYGMTYHAGTGSLYVTETSNYDIRKITVSGAAVTTLSGTSRATGYTDGTAATATFSRPVDLSSDDTHLYVTDGTSHVVRKVSLSDGSVTTLAGTHGHAYYVEGTGAAARFNGPGGVAVAGGYVYVVDTNNAVIRKVHPTTGATTRFAGAPLGTAGFDPELAGQATDIASFSNVMGMTTIDGDIFYLTQPNTHTVRKLDLTAKTVTTIAGAAGVIGSTDGTGANARFSQPWGIVQVGTSLYVTEYANHTVRRIDLSPDGNGVQNYDVTTIAGTSGAFGSSNNNVGTSASFRNPEGIVSDGTKLYIADTSNHRIRSIVIDLNNADGNAGTDWPVATVAGSSSGFSPGNGTGAQFKQPADLVLDGSVIYVSDQGNSAIRKIDTAASNAVTTIAGTGTAGLIDGAGTVAQFSGPRKLLVVAGDLYVADNVNGRIRKVDLTDNSVTTAVGTASAEITIHSPGAGALSRATGVFGMTAFGNKIYFGSGSVYSIRSYDVVNDYQETVAGYATNQGASYRIEKGARDGALLKTYNMPTRAGAIGPHIYTISSTDYTVRRMARDGSGMTLIAGGAGQPGAVDGVGTAARFGSLRGRPMSDGEFLYVFDGSSSTLRRMSLADATVDTIAGAHGQVATVDGAAASARLGIVNDAVLVGHAIYFTQRENHVLRKVSLEPATLGQISTVVGTLNTPGSDDGDAASALLNQPLALAAIGAKIYIADTGNNVIRAFDTVTLKVATVAGTAGACAGAVDGATATFCNVSSLTSDNDGYLYALDNYQTTVRKIRASDGWTSTFLGTIGQRRDDGAGPLPTAMYPASLEFVPGLGLLVTAQGGLSVRLIK